MKHFEITNTPTRAYIGFVDKDIYDGRFGISMSNSKVQLPIVNVEPALECTNKLICPFSLENYKKSGYPRCYAQDGEIRWTSVRKSREDNKDFLQIIMRNEEELLHGFVMSVIMAIKRNRPFTPYVRINEAGDLNPNNIKFFERLQMMSRANGFHLYGYSKSPKKLYANLVEDGATILRSETDFVVVASEEEAKMKGYRLCPGVCGPCVWCMEFDKNSKPIAIVGH